MKVACLLITHLRTKVEVRRHPDLKSTPAVIVGRSKGRSMVVDSTPYTSGVSPGMTLEEALSIRSGDSRPRSRRASLPQGVRSGSRLTAGDQRSGGGIGAGDGLCPAGRP